MVEKGMEADGRTFVEARGTKLEITRRGTGRPILFLHAEMGVDPFGRDLEALNGLGEIIIPSLPGFGRSELPRHVSTIHDLSYILLDLLDVLDLRHAVLVGASFGGWLAAETAVKSTSRIDHLILSAPYGAKWGGPEDVEIADMFMLSREEFHDLAYADPAAARRDPTMLDDDGVAHMARNWEAAALFGWLPYMHNPKLRHRLHRIDIPTLLLWGDHDRVIGRDYIDKFAGVIPGATHKVIPGAGHYPHLEQPKLFNRQIAGFIDPSGVLDETPPVETMLP